MRNTTVLKGIPGSVQVWLKWKSMKFSKERAITDLHTPTGSWDIEAQSHKHGRRHFLDFKPHFRLNEDQYDFTTKHNGKMKV